MSKSILKSFYSPDHAGMRLAGTLIRVKGRPTYITRVRGEWNAEGIDAETSQGITIADIRDESVVDASPVPLGFCQLSEQARYLSRTPARRTKQGLEMSSLHSEGPPLPNIFESSQLLKALSSTVNNNYPTFVEAVKGVRKKVDRSLAFHRNWAVFNNGGESLVILYKFFGAVGWVDDHNHINLNPVYEYLKETLEEEVGDQYD